MLSVLIRNAGLLCLHGLAAGLLGVFASAAQAAGPVPACGVYVNAQLGEIRVLGPELMQRRGRDSTPELLHYRRDGDRLRVFNLDLGMDDSYVLRDEGRGIDTGMDFVFVLNRRETCQPAWPPAKTAAGQVCWRDLKACSDDSVLANDTVLRELCADRLGFACRKLMAGDPASQLGAMLSGGPQPKPLPAERLEEAARICLSGVSGPACREAAEANWDGGRYLRARALLRQACGQPIADPTACQAADGMASLTESMLAVPPMPGLPTGRFVSATGLVRTLEFGADGLATEQTGLKMPVRLENGLIYLRHNRGGDFILRRVDTRTLIGLDIWNHLAVYVAQSGPR